MKTTPFWEDIEINSTLPMIEKYPTTRQLVQYAGVSGDFYEIHYDKDFAIATGLSGVIIHGALKSAFLVQIITDWMGPDGQLKSFACQYRGMDVPNDILTCKGIITDKYAKDGHYIVECKLWLENSSGTTTTPGTATVSLPSKNLSLIHI